MSTTTVNKKVNGVDVTKLYQAVDAIKTVPSLGDFKFRVKNQWIDCGRNRSSIQDFYGLNAEDNSREKPFVLDVDEPAVLLGTDLAPNAGEYLLHTLAACVTGTIVYHAAARGIRIQALESQVEGDIDLRGFLGIDDSVPRGFKNIRMKFRIKTDGSEEQLQEVLDLGPAFSPVYGTLTNGVKIDIQLDK
jgi:uncharacterized OsmC-like protein